MNRGTSISTYLGAVIFALGCYVIPLGILAACISLGWYADPEPQPVAAVVILGDDNGDGIIDEDESGWDCATMGNLVCGQVIA